MSEQRPRLYLLDVEGAVAPLTLTTEVLFPYVRKHLNQFLDDNIDDPVVRADLELLAEENQADTDPSLPVRRTVEKWTGPVDGQKFRLFAFMYLTWLMDRDRKSTALKSLQGKIWKEGFESGELKGTVFDDVPPAFERWASRAKVAIYSSGSVDAQKLFFRHSSHGDLSPHISGYFDTRTGPKMEPASYCAIAAAMSVEPREALFFSDAVKELDAAREAGFETRLTVRLGNIPVDDNHGHLSIESLALL
jgi:enolase-phosphatase E1